jgi:hypothetical protein
MLFTSGDGQHPGGASSPDRQKTGDPAVAVCGFSDLSSITAADDTPSEDIFEPIVDSIQSTDDFRFQTFTVSGDTIAVLHSNYDAESTVTLYSTSGDRRAQFTVDQGMREGDEVFLASDIALDPDGSVYLVDANGGDNAIVKYSADGEEQWSVDLSDLDRGRVFNVFTWHDSAGEDAIGVGFTSGSTIAVLSPDGRFADEQSDIEGTAFFPQPDGTLVSTVGSERGGSYLQVYDHDGTVLSRFGSSDETSGESRTGAPPALGTVSGVAPAPDGSLLIAADHQGIAHVDAGLRLGVATDGAMDFDAEYWFVPGTPLFEHEDRYFLAMDDRAGGINIVSANSDDLLSLVNRPVKYNEVHGPWQAILGYGAGLVTQRPLNYFPPGEEPEVDAVFDPWWTTHSDQLDLRYRVSGDPRGSEGAGEVHTIELPDQIGQAPLRVPLELPPAVPGPYQVHAELVDSDSGQVVSSTCLNYSVAGTDAHLDFTSLAEGADWGGAHPLRGVQLADQLGIGSHRWQLDFGSIVTDPGAEPSPDALSWEGLPGAENGSPFAELARAASLAAETDVTLILQLGSGGEAEREAVENGTWGAWVREIVTVLRDEVPDLKYWADWNEPNNTGFDNGEDYTRDVLVPFADAVRQGDPDAVVIGGNTLGTVPDWWSQAIDAGVCDALDVVSVHPYTAHNRSWEEDGMVGPGGQIEQLKEAVDDCLDAGKPLWNTESGWWADGPANFWAQADDVVRAYLWMRAEGIDEWTYFFSEGGFGETGNSWSLIQFYDYVKPGALAFMTVSALVDGRPAPEPVETAIPFTHAMRIDPSATGTNADNTLLAAWTDELVLPVRLTSDAASMVDVTVTDVYGATETITIPADGTTEVQLSGSPQFFAAPAGVELGLEAVEPFGDNLLADGSASASSADEGYPPHAVLKDDATSTAVWLSGPEAADGQPDLEPWLQVTIDQPVTINRIAVATRSIRCCTGGLRNYTVSARVDGEWQVVAEQHDQFFERTVLFTFDPLEADGVRIDIPSRTESGVEVMDVNYSGSAGGLRPAWWPLMSQSDQIAAISTIAAYAPEPGR